MSEMPTFAVVAARASDAPAFANGTEGEAWISAWCYRGGAECVHDDIEYGGTSACPLLSVAMLGRTPVEWGERTSALGREMYTCTRYQAPG